MYPPSYFTYLGLLVISLGPILLIFQRNFATPVEKFVYLSMMAPSAFIVSFLMYGARKRLIFKNFYGSTREQKLVQLHEEFRIIFFWLGIGAVLLIGSLCWYFFGLQ